MKPKMLVHNLRRWHRRLGLLACIPAIVLSITGILANHSVKLGWDRTPISSPWILKSYGFEAPETYRGVNIGGALWTPSQSQLFRDEVLVSSCDGSWHSVTPMASLVVASCTNKIHLFTPQGESVEQIHQLPHSYLVRSGRVANEYRLLLQFQEGQYLLNLDTLEVEPVSGLEIEPEKTEAASAPIINALRQQFQVHGLTWERYLLDIHSGRWFGSWGWILVDLGGLFILILSVSGLLVYCLKRAR